MNGKSPDTVCFRSPLTQVIGDIFSNGLLLSIPVLLLLFFFEAAASAAVLAVLLPGLFWAMRTRSGPFWSLRIRAGELQLGGFFFNCFIPCTEIRFVRGGSLIEKAIGVSGSQQLVIETGRKKFKIRLRPRDIDACLRQILVQAPQAGGADYSRVEIKAAPLTTGVTIDMDRIVEFLPHNSSPDNDARARSGQYLRDCGLWLLAAGGLFFAGIVLKLVRQAGDMAAGDTLLYFLAALVVCAMGAALVAAGAGRRAQPAAGADAGDNKQEDRAGPPHE